MDPAYLSAFSALAGAAIGGLTSFATSWSTQQAQLRHALRQAERTKLEALYSEFITEASRLFGDALGHQTEDISTLVRLNSMIGRMHLMSDRAVVEAARRVEAFIVETYLGPNRSLREVMDFVRTGGTDLLTEFSEVCRKDLSLRALPIR